MDRFVRELLALPPMEAAEELVLARLARRGDPVAREALITAGMRLVALRARSKGFTGDALNDAIQSGAVGLISAVDRFDPDRGARLATYSWHWIGSAMDAPRRSEVPIEDADRAVDDAEPYEPDLLAGLPDEQVAVLELRFGLGGTDAEPLPRHRVAERLGMTTRQVRAIETKAMRQLRTRLAKVVDRAPPQGGADPQ